MLCKKKAGTSLAVRLIAAVLALLMIAVVVHLVSFPMRVQAAGSNTLSGSESIVVYLQDSGWQSATQVRVKQLGSDDSVKKTETLPPSSNKLNVTGAAGAAKIVLEQYNAAKNANLLLMNAVINSASSTQMVVFYDNTSAQWTDLKYYAWTKKDGVTHKDADWDNRKSLTRLSTSSNIWYAKIDRNASLTADYENIIFTGSGSQTDDLELKASKVGDVHLYSSTTNNWIVYTDVDRSVTAAVKDRYSNDHNNLYVVSKTAAKWSKYNSSSPTATVYYKPNTTWDNAYVHYDDDVNEPFYTTVQMTVENNTPLIFKATVYEGAMVSFSDGPDFDTSAKKDQGSVFDDTSEPVYVSKDRSWTTLDNAKANDIYPSDMTVKATNFDEVTPTGGGKIIGFDAYYYDYLSNNELVSGWRQNLNDDPFEVNGQPGPAGPDGSAYRTQFSSFNDDIKNLALSSTDWRYPLFFGDDYNTNSFITNYYNAIKNSRNPSITHDNFNAVNNSNYLGGDNSRSVMGLVKPQLKNGYLMITDSKRSPYFDDEFLQQKGSIQKEVLYIIDDANYTKDGIYCNFWGNGSVYKDHHPEQVTSGNVTIGGVTGKLYRYVVDKNMTGCQLSHTTDYGNNFWNYQPNGEWVVSRFTGIVKTSGGDVTDNTYKSGIQSVASSENRAKILSSKFPFVETTDPTTKVKTYIFDSNGSTRKDNISIQDDKIYYYNNNGYKGKLDGNNGFFPFNGANHETRNYGFGVRVDMDFTIPKNGMLTATKPAEFKYSGDDDVWVFIDGNLILDIGGAHTPTSGTINFGAGTNQIKATTAKVYGEMSTTSSSDSLKNGAAVEKTFSFNNTDPTKKHRMTVFYMERGTNDSNLRIEFSIQPILNELNVYKEVEAEDVNHGFADTVKTLAENSDFGFTFLQNGSGYGGTAGKTYNIVHADDTTTTDTIKNGAFKLKNYEEAMFHNDTDLTFGDTMKVTEAAASTLANGNASPFVYDTDIEVKDNLFGDTITTTSQTDKDVSFNFKNGRNDANERTSLVTEFTNTMQIADLKVQKKLYQKDSTVPSEHDTPFRFTLGLDLDNDGTYELYDFDYYYEGHESEVFTAHSGVFQMRPSQKVIIEGIPVGTPYQLTESAKAGYRNKDTYTQTGTVPAGQTTLTFNNEESPSSQNIDVKKMLDNQLYSGNEFTFTCALVKWIKTDTTEVTDATMLGAIYSTSNVSSVRANGVVGFDPFNIVPDDESSGTYVLEISEVDKSSTKPMYIYDSQKYYAKIVVNSGNVSAPTFYKDLACTDAVSDVTFKNRTAKGSITVNKTDSNNAPLAGTQFALIKVSSESDVDALLTPENINTLVQANPDKVSLQTTVVNGNVASAKFDDLDLYQSGGMFVKQGDQVVWSDQVSSTAKQVYCVFEYTPTSGFLPNYTKTYVTLADEPNSSFTFGMVDAPVVMPNSSGSGSALYQWLGLGVIAFAAMLLGAYFIKRRHKKPVHATRFI